MFRSADRALPPRGACTLGAALLADLAASAAGADTGDHD